MLNVYYDLFFGRLHFSSQKNLKAVAFLITIFPSSNTFAHSSNEVKRRLSLFTKEHVPKMHTSWMLNGNFK